MVFEYLLLKLGGLAKIALEGFGLYLLHRLDAHIGVILRPITLTLAASRLQIGLPGYHGGVVLASAVGLALEIREGDLSVAFPLDRVDTMLDVCVAARLLLRHQLG